MYRRGLGATEAVITKITYGGEAPSQDPNACVGGYDSYGQVCADFSAITNDPTATAQALKYLYGQGSQPATAQPVNVLSKYSNIIIIAGVGLLALMVLGPGVRR